MIKSPKSNGECLTRTEDIVQEAGSSKDSKDIKDSKDKNNVQNKFSLEDLQFSFETVPKSEPWYQTFQRQDEGREYYTCFSDSGT